MGNPKDEYLLSGGFIRKIYEGWDQQGILTGDSSVEDPTPPRDTKQSIMVKILSVFVPEEEDAGDYYSEDGKVAQFTARQVKAAADGSYINMNRIFDIEYDADDDEDSSLGDLVMPYNLFGLDLDFTNTSIVTDLESYVDRVVTATFMPITVPPTGGSESDPDIETVAYAFSKVGGDGEGANFGYWTAGSLFDTRTLPPPDPEEPETLGAPYAIYTGQTVADDWFVDVPNGLEPVVFTDQTVVIKNLGSGAFRMEGHNFQVVRGNWVDPEETPVPDPENPEEDLPLTIVSVWVCQAPIFY